MAAAHHFAFSDHAGSGFSGNGNSSTISWQSTGNGDRIMLQVRPRTRSCVAAALECSILTKTTSQPKQAMLCVIGQSVCVTG